MPDPKPDRLLHRRPVRASVGVLAGLLLGPLTASALVQAPSGEWPGPHPPSTRDCEVIAAVMGVCCGPAVGLVVALLAASLQRGEWEGSSTYGTERDEQTVERRR